MHPSRDWTKLRLGYGRYLPSVEETSQVLLGALITPILTAAKDSVFSSVGLEIEGVSLVSVCMGLSEGVALEAHAERALTCLP